MGRFLADGCDYSRHRRCRRSILFAVHRTHCRKSARKQEARSVHMQDQGGERFVQHQANPFRSTHSTMSSVRTAVFFRSLTQSDQVKPFS